MEPQDIDLALEGQIRLKQWEWKYLRSRCRALSLEPYYLIYKDRLNTTLISVFIFYLFAYNLLHIITLLAFVHFLKKIFVNIIIYFIATSVGTGLLFLNFNRKLNERLPWLLFATNCLAVFTFFLSDYSVMFFKKEGSRLNFSFDHILILSIYMFLPFRTYWHYFAVGGITSLVYFVLGLVSDKWQTAIHNMIFYIVLNIMGIFYQHRREYDLRISILNRHQLLEQHLMLKQIQAKEKIILKSILPENIAESVAEDVQARIKANQNRNYLQRTLFIEPHPNVSILYADLVNYTTLTTKLKVHQLVEILHELFVQFDTAAERNNVLPIKFLGDCYVCVAGVPLPNLFHAKCCVNLGFNMIDVLRTIRDKHHLDIDMRIGVHSGEIFSGIIGSTKWHFDIWSKDVDIANRMENTGKAGFVHVSENTLALLENEYNYENGTNKALHDPILQRYGMKTFIITEAKDPDKLTETIFISFPHYRRSTTTQDLLASTSSLMNINRLQKLSILKMETEVYKMPIGRIQFAKIFNCAKEPDRSSCEDVVFETNIRPLWMLFLNSYDEWRFLNEPDNSFNYFTLLAVFVGMAATSSIMVSPTLIYFVVLNVVMILLSFLVYYRKLWLMFVSKSKWDRPTKGPSRVIYNTSVLIRGSLFARISIFVFYIFSLLTLNTIQMYECNMEQYELAMIEWQLEDHPNKEIKCFDPKRVTLHFVLILTLCMLFSRLPYIFKFTIGWFIVVFYSIIVLIRFDTIFEYASTSNLGFRPEYSHLWYVISFFLLLILIERHIVYIQKVDYTAKRRFLYKQNQTEAKTKSIQIILNNVLPSHVAQRFINQQLDEELFSESFDNVATMFATIENYDPEKIGIRVLNEIICYFDSLLNEYEGKIEKIKVANWTYMAACGLQANEPSMNLLMMDESTYPSVKSKIRYGIDKKVNDNRESPNSNWSAKTSYYITEDDEVVLTMTQFALDLLRIMHDINVQDIFLDSLTNKQGKLKIGISHGPIMAGVVGISRLHYDIWGNSVNLASRMNSTGLQDQIHVTENTATILRGFNIKCDYRGLTTIKGVGLLPTYLVAIDEDLNFISNDDIPKDDLDSLDMYTKSSQSA